MEPLKADTLVNVSRKPDARTALLFSFILPSSARTEPLRTTLVVSWMKFSSLHFSDRRRFVLLLRELVRVYSSIVPEMTVLLTALL